MQYQHSTTGSLHVVELGAWMPQVCQSGVQNGIRGRQFISMLGSPAQSSRFARTTNQPEVPRDWPLRPPYLPRAFPESRSRATATPLSRPPCSATLRPPSCPTTSSQRPTCLHARRRHGRRALRPRLTAYLLPTRATSVACGGTSWTCTDWKCTEEGHGRGG